PATFNPSVRICCSAVLSEDIVSPVRGRDGASSTVELLKSGSSTNEENNVELLENGVGNSPHELNNVDSNTKRNMSRHKRGMTNDGGGGGGGEDNRTRLINSQFRLANACLKCISEYVSYHDVHPILQRAILPRLLKASGYHHKKYLLYAALETALRRRLSTRTRPLNDLTIRIVLQCPLKERQVRNEIHELSQLLIQNLLLPQYKLDSFFFLFFVVFVCVCVCLFIFVFARSIKTHFSQTTMTNKQCSVRYDSEDPEVYRTNIRLFESQIGKKEALAVSNMEFEVDKRKKKKKKKKGGAHLFKKKKIFFFLK
ncbi:hypothetical protein RFI_13752, partial [Reticulomyxa filosa]